MSLNTLPAMVTRPGLGAVERMVAMAIRAAHSAGIKVGICGQAPSSYPDFAEFLIRKGIDSISLNPDSFLRTAARIADVERALASSVASSPA